MLAVGADADTVASAIKESTMADLWLANINAPRQTVVSGTVRAIEALHGRLSAVGHHCAPPRGVGRVPQLAGAQRGGAAAPSFWRGSSSTAPRIDVYGNADAAIYRGEADAIRRTLAEHIAAPVRFLDQIEAMYADGVRTFIEVGAGSALTGLIGAILGDRDHVAVSLDKRGRDGVTAWHEAVGRLAAHGVPMDLTKLSQDSAAQAQRSRAARGPSSNVRARQRNGLHPALPRQSRCQALPAPSAHVLPASDSSGARRPHDRARPPPPPGAEPAPQPSGWPPCRRCSARRPRRTCTSSACSRTPTRPSSRWPRTRSPCSPGSRSHSQLTAAAGPGARAHAPGAVRGARRRSTGRLNRRSRNSTSRAYLPGPSPAESAAATEPVSLALLLSVVADKTGYPVDMLNGGMDLETDLGIDSIKKVEIFAAVRQRAEGLPPTDSPQMAQLFEARTLDEVMRGAADDSAVPAVADTVAADAAVADTEQAGEQSPTAAVRRIHGQAGRRSGVRAGAGGPGETDRSPSSTAAADSRRPWSRSLTRTASRPRSRTCPSATRGA